MSIMHVECFEFSGTIINDLISIAADVNVGDCRWVGISIARVIVFAII